MLLKYISNIAKYVILYVIFLYIHIDKDYIFIIYTYKYNIGNIIIYDNIICLCINIQKSCNFIFQLLNFKYFNSLRILNFKLQRGYPRMTRVKPPGNF